MRRACDHKFKSGNYEISDSTLFLSLAMLTIYKLIDMHLLCTVQSDDILMALTAKMHYKTQTNQTQSKAKQNIKNKP